MKTLTSLPISRVDLFVCLTCLSVFLSVVSVCYSIRRVCLLLYLSCLSATLSVVSVYQSICRVCLLVYLLCLYFFFVSDWYLIVQLPIFPIPLCVLVCILFRQYQAIIVWDLNFNIGSQDLTFHLQYWDLGLHFIFNIGTWDLISISILGPRTSFYFQYWDLGLHISSSILGPGTSFHFQYWDLGLHFIFNSGTWEFILFSILGPGTSFRL